MVEVGEYVPESGEVAVIGDSCSDVLIEEMTKEIDSLKSGDQAVSMMGGLVRGQVQTWIQMGGVLQRMRDEGWLAGCGFFEEMAEVRFGIRKSTAYDLMAIYRTLRQVNLTRKDMQELGLTKLRMLCRHAPSEKFSTEEFSKRLENAKGMTTRKLADQLKKESPPNPANETKTLVFKPHPDQYENIRNALDKIKDQGDTDHDTVALDYICMEYLGGPALPMAVHLRAIGLAETLALLSEHDPKSDPEFIVVDYLKELGESKALGLLHKAFPDLELPAA